MQKNEAKRVRPLVSFFCRHKGRNLVLFLAVLLTKGRWVVAVTGNPANSLAILNCDEV